MTNTDKARQDELSTRASNYSSKTPSDNQERVTLGQIVSQLNDEARIVSGATGGLQQKK
jgi:hypothetical protein